MHLEAITAETVWCSLRNNKIRTIPSNLRKANKINKMKTGSQSASDQSLYMAKSENVCLPVDWYWIYGHPYYTDICVTMSWSPLLNRIHNTLCLQVFLCGKPCIPQQKTETEKTTQPHFWVYFLHKISKNNSDPKYEASFYFHYQQENCFYSRRIPSPVRRDRGHT